jgi:hypothetical protein
MPSFDNHFNQAVHNANLISAIVASNLQDEYSDWYATVSFYSAVHYLEAIFDELQIFIFTENGIKQRIRHSDEARKCINTYLCSEIEKCKKTNDAKAISLMRKQIFSDHQSRKRIILDNDILRDFYKPYGKLEEVCKKARYYCFNPKTYNPNSIRQWLTEIEKLFTEKSKQKQIPPKPKEHKWAQPLSAPAEPPLKTPAK